MLRAPPPRTKLCPYAYGQRFFEEQSILVVHWSYEPIRITVPSNCYQHNSVMSYFSTEQSKLQ